MAGLKLLVTSGATRESIDSVRFISNVSTGETGAKLADFFASVGFEVTYLHGVSAALPSSDCERVEFTDFGSLDGKLRELLSMRKYFAVLQLAAVSDYSVEEVIVGGRLVASSGGKIDSGEELELRLRRNPKLVSRLKEYGGVELQVVAFKLTSNASTEEALAALARLHDAGGMDWIVHNDLGELARARAQGREQEFHLLDAKNLETGRVAVGTAELATALIEAWKREAK